MDLFFGLLQNTPWKSGLAKTGPAGPVPLPLNNGIGICDENGIILEELNIAVIELF